MSQFRLVDILDKTIISEESGGDSYASKSPAVWPSECSAWAAKGSTQKIIGKCHRASFLRMIAYGIKREVDSIGAWRWVLGRYVESHVTELTEVADPVIWVANGIKFYNKSLSLSMEIDILVRDPHTNKAYIVECKSFYGNAAKRQYIGFNPGPKTEHLMQICMYLFDVKTGKRLKEIIKQSLLDREEAEKKGTFTRNRCKADLPMVESLDDGEVFGKLLYISRDEGHRTEFDVSIKQHEDGMHYPYVNGTCVPKFTIESIFERYKTLQNYWYTARNKAVEILESKGIKIPSKLHLILSSEDLNKEFPYEEYTDEEKTEIQAYYAALEAQVRALPDSYWPPAEYEFSYSDDRIEELYKAGDIGKTKYQDWKSTKTNNPTHTKKAQPTKRKAKPTPRIGNFNCEYCSYGKVCIPKQKPDLAYQLYSIQTIEDDDDVEFEDGESTD